MTFKQLEAIYWVVRLGGFAQAANKLHTTQSAVSKRIQELEALFETPLFDRSRRTARLTEKGDEMFLLAQRLLEQRDAAVEQFQRPEVTERHVRIGVTELTAMTWLPRLIGAIQRHYPRVIIEPHVDASVVLRDKLLADEVDLMIVPEVFNDQRFVSRPVGVVENAWMCKPGLVGPCTRLRMHELAAHRLLTQDDRSGTGLLYNRWLRSIGVQPDNLLFSNSVVALIGLTVSGMGVSYLPKKCLAPMIESGTLEALKVTPALPPATYSAFCKADQRSSLVSSIARIAEESCDFGRIFQTA
ncbi:LysR family transcriptional regulator [Calidifontimicrobium sp. SYSU G02091]|uniref:LysR family transcriptional regulator n=1 Tax=Calidifontimicrobium sp. SYSU G02091 TaxID=2926421 RepID=UPI001F53409F|nr:LysR family transcriptional regulator [Calidifontimicrobium sp. SYSU G02091]MCI1193381.1 LysR family transcriptional regulator [Calidifontimicrobium sp. SYSU G02091]